MDKLADTWVVVVAWRSAAQTVHLVTHLLMTWPMVKVVLVASGSPVNVAPDPRLTVVNVDNLGYAGGNNVGFRTALAAGARWVLVLNSDAYPLPGSLERLVENLSARADWAASGAALVRWCRDGMVELNTGTGFDWVSGHTFPAAAIARPTPVQFPCGAAVLFRGDALRQIGGFDAHLFLYFEEVDWCERSRAAGFEVVVDPGGRALHLGSTSTIRAPRAVAYYSARNRLWILRRYGSRHDARVSGSREALVIARSLAALVRRHHYSVVIPHLRGVGAGLGRVPPVVDRDNVAKAQQRYEARPSGPPRRTPRRLTRRARRWLEQDELSEHPLRVIRRRLQYLFESNFLPWRVGIDRLSELDGDLRMWTRLDDDIERNVFLLGVYDHTAARTFERLLPAGGTAVDVGAHVGQFTLLAARAVGASGRVVAFEPQPSIRQRLQRNIRTNGFTNVTVLSTALSDRRGRRAFHSSEGEANSGLASFCADGSTCSFPHVDVHTDTLDSVLAASGASPADVLKLDVEGAESEVLAGALRLLERHKPAVLFEANDAPVQGHLSCPSVDLLRALGYDFYALGPADGEHPNLVPCDAADRLGESVRPGRPRNLVAVHPGSRGAFRAERWIFRDSRNHPHRGAKVHEIPSSRGR